LNLTRKKYYDVVRWAIVGIALASAILLVIVVREPKNPFRSKIAKIYPFSSVIKERDSVITRTKFTTINHYLPSFQPLSNYITEYDHQSWPRGYSLYYERVVEAFPQISDAHGMLGICYYYENQPEKSILSFQKAIALNPNYFWYYYNLGAVHFNAQQWGLAAQAFHKATLSDPQKTMVTIQVSKIYQQIIASSRGFHYSFGEQLKQAYQQAYLFKDFSLKASSGENMEQFAPKLETKINLRIF